MVRVAYFSNQFADAEGHGLARYAREMYRELSQISDLDVLPVAAWSSLRGRELARLQRDTSLHLLRTGRRVTPLAWHYLNYPPIETLLPNPIDVVHAASLGYAIATRKPFVVTIHDLGPLTRPEYFTNKKPYIMQRSLAQAESQAVAIVCVSESTANEVEHFLGPHVVPRLKIIKEGVSPEFFESPDMKTLEELPLPETGTPFILSAGKISPRKNIQGVLDAFAMVADQIPDHLVLVGGAGWEMDAVLERMNNRSISGRVHLLNYVSDTQLRALYQSAALYIHPSLYEGFGLTVLEAMASGVPVVTSNTSSLPEVAGDAGTLVDPENTDSIANAILELRQNPELAAQKVERGKRRAEQFRWDDCAGQLADLFKDVAAR